MGFLGKVPNLPVLRESIRNLYFHVCMWMSMMTFFIISVYYAIKYLLKPLPKYDLISFEFARIGFVYGILGLITGSVWANYTWGEPWSNDPKQVGALISLMIYTSYFLLRNSILQPNKKAKLSAVFNIFSFAMLFPSIWIIPRLVESLHPGGMGNPAMNTSDVDINMRIVFYPAIIAWTLLGVWIASLRIRISNLQNKI